MSQKLASREACFLLAKCRKTLHFFLTLLIGRLVFDTDVVGDSVCMVGNKTKKNCVKSFHKGIIITATRIIIKKHLCKVVMFAEKEVLKGGGK